MADVEEVQNGAAPAKTAVPASTANFTGMKPQLLVEAPKATDVVQFYKTAFGALEIGCSMETKRKAEQNVGTGCTLCLETEDIHAALANAVSAGAVAKGESTILMVSHGSFALRSRNALRWKLESCLI
ncbi:hypothetical protein KPL70_016100 [Citrus sinensis]|nr:hypothetical protein KPL70_016100 [Citrus sinensis]